MRRAKHVRSSLAAALALVAFASTGAAHATDSPRPHRVLQRATPPSAARSPPGAPAAASAEGSGAQSSSPPIRRRLSPRAPTAARLRIAFSLATPDIAATDPAEATLAFVEHTRGLHVNTTTLTSLAYSMQASVSLATLTHGGGDTHADEAIVQTLQSALGSFLSFPVDDMQQVGVTAVGGGSSPGPFAAPSAVMFELYPVQTLAALQRRVVLLRYHAAAFDKRLAAVADAQRQAAPSAASQDALQALAQQAGAAGTLCRRRGA